MLDIFDILGPVMVGPSSSHTAGAVRIGNMARTLLGEEPRKVALQLHGSFAETGKGHGTDKALVAGLLGLRPDNMDIPISFEMARERGVDFHFLEVQLRDAHPNTVVLEVEGVTGRTLNMQACSTGGGRIKINKLDGIQVEFSGDYSTLIIYNQDDCGEIADVTTLLSQWKVNIANMRLHRNNRGGMAIMVIETDQAVPPVVLHFLGEIAGIEKVTYYEKEAE